MGLDEFFQKEDWRPRFGARLQDFGSALQGVQGGNLQRYNQTVERDERRGNIAALMDNMGIGGNRRALLDMLPQEGQVSSLYDMLGQQDAAAAAAASNARFNQLFGGGQPPVTPAFFAPITSMPISEPMPNTPEGFPASIVGAVQNPAITYTNQGAIRNRPISERLNQSLGFLGDMGIRAEVFSGGQPAAEEGGARVGSPRHDGGDSADVKFFMGDRMLDWNNPDDIPILQDIVRRGRANGLTGFGAGNDYMGAGAVHIGFGEPAVWGSGGKGSTAPAWLAEAFNAPVSGQPQGQPAQPNERLMRLFQLANDPNLSEGNRAYVNAIIEQEMSQQDQTADIQNYQFYASQEAQAGREPASFNDWKNQGRASGATVVNIGTDGQQYPNPPSGYVYARTRDGEVALEADENGFMRPRIVPFAGSPAEAEAAQEAAQAEARSESKATDADTVVTFIDKALELMNESDLNTGIIGQLSSGIESWPAGRLNSALTTVKGNIGFEALQEMRDNSPTGGALGQVSTFELENLQSLEGQLNVGMNEGDLRENLERIKESRQILLRAIEADKLKTELSIPESFISDPEVIDAIKRGVDLRAIWEAYNG